MWLGKFNFLKNHCNSLFLLFVVHSFNFSHCVSIVPKGGLELQNPVQNGDQLISFTTDYYGEENEVTTDPSVEDFQVLATDNSTESTVPKAPLNCQCGKRVTSVPIDGLKGFETVQKQNARDGEIPLIVGGKDAYRGEFPWLAALLKTNPYAIGSGPRVICGASLINSRFLVTAAHCIQRQFKERLSIALHAHKITTANDVRNDPEVLILKIKRLIPHPKFNLKTVDNDIGIIELAEPVDLIKLSDKIRPVCLPASSADQYADRVATVAGWGYTRPAAGVSSPDVRKANVPILPQEKCSKTAYGSKILPSMLCAGYDEGGIDACTNDSGGPLILEDEATSTLVGVVSWGHSCAKPKLPGVYTRVGNYLDWIQQHAKKGEYCMQG